MCACVQCDRTRQLLARGFSKVWPLRLTIVELCTPATGRFQHRCHATDVKDRYSSLLAGSLEPLQEVRRKNRELRDLLRTLPWPSLKSFEAHGNIYDLPQTNAGPSLTLPMTARLRYLAGFFGDGCVTSNNGMSGCKLTIGQAINQAAVLLLFRDAFGGSITQERHGVGLHQPVLRWTASGCNATRAARLLAPFSITKHKQLLLAAAWPQARPERQQWKQELVHLKYHDSAVACHCSLEYIAGFFDAEGHVRAAGQAAVSLHVAQKFSTVLACLKDSLAMHLNVDARIQVYSKISLLYITRTAECKQVLHAFLQAGLLCKAEQANLATSLTPQNMPQIRAALGMRVGEQGFGKRLDEDGMRRSVKIASAKQEAMRLKRQGELNKAEAKLLEIEGLKHEHELLNACRENQQLHEYMCDLRRFQGVTAHKSSKVSMNRTRVCSAIS